YDLTGTLSMGGMGTVYTGRHRALNSLVAIKVLPPEIATSEVRLARFRREAALAARLSHPHIVPVFEFDVRNGLAFLVMPLIDGATLQDHVLQRGRLTYTETAELVRQVGSALAFAHDRGIVHRDVKPSNILLERATARWLLTDFGIAHVDAPPEQDVEITRTGESVGTPAYMAPEQAGGASDVDARADLYSLAATALYALTGERPDLLRDRSGLARSLRATRSDLTPAMADALTAPLEPVRDDRPPDMRFWLDAVSAAERRRPVRPWAAVAMLVLAATIGWWAQREKPEIRAASRPMIMVLPFWTSGRAPGIDLDSVLPQALAWQLQMLPDYRVIGSPVVSAAIRRRFGEEPVSLDTLLDLARNLGATRVVAGQAETTRGFITIRIQIHDPAGHRIVESVDTAGAVDSLHALVSGLVVRGFAARLARERSGLPSPSLPRGLPAIAAYFQGDQDLRRAAYDEAVEQFNRVIGLDSTYAPAYLKRMLAVVQLLPTEAEIRSAMPGVAHKSRLDPVSRQLLEAYERLINDGDVRHAIQLLQDLVVKYPDAVDGWFALAELQFHFGTLVGYPLSDSKASFQEVLARDPSFATAIAHLLMLALAEKDDAAARSYISRYLAIERSSVPAQLIAIADTLLYHRRYAFRLVESFPRRPAEVLEEIAFIASEFGRSGAERAIGNRALDALWQRSAGGEGRARAFRMLLAHYLGAGRYGSARALVQQARESGVRHDELDRWIVLSGITRLPELGDGSSQAAAARRLRTTRIDPVVARWLAARWFARRDPEEAADALQDFQRLVRPPGQASPLELSLSNDLSAWDRLATGDTAGALATWRLATQRFSIEQVPFATAASLWPLRLSRVRFAMLTHRYREALDVSATFLRITAYVDQAAWPEVLPLRAAAALAVGDTALAMNTYADLVDRLELADGDGIAIRDRAMQALEELRARRQQPLGPQPSAVGR
ncbi:MAG: protein kinase, partial [Gemmatimonadetes bacterium]|nr:protein kinase [Gemmatimonadota bacterium]